MSTATGLRNWKDTAGRAVEKSSPYVKRGGKWLVVHVLTPLLFYLKEIAIAAVASLLVGCQTSGPPSSNRSSTGLWRVYSDYFAGAPRKLRPDSAGSGTF